MECLIAILNVFKEYQALDHTKDSAADNGWSKCTVQLPLEFPSNVKEQRP